MWAVGLWTFFTGSRLGRIAGLGLLALVALGAFKGYVAWERADAAKAARVKFLQEALTNTQKESDRRQKAIDAARKLSDNDASRIEALEGKLATKQKEIEHASRKNDRKACLDAGAVLRLDGLR